MNNRSIKTSTFNIMYYSVALTFGGEQKQLVKIFSHLNGKYFQPVVCCMRPFDYVEQMILDLAYKFICLKEPNRYNIFREIKRIRGIIKENSIDLVYMGIFGSGSEFTPLAEPKAYLAWITVPLPLGRH